MTLVFKTHVLSCSRFFVFVVAVLFLQDFGGIALTTEMSITGFLLLCDYNF